MSSDLDIYRTANVLIREHGEDAALNAAAQRSPGRQARRRPLHSARRTSPQQPRRVVVHRPTG